MGLSKRFLFGQDCRQKLFKGIDLMHRTVSATLGPHGRTVLLEKVAHTIEPSKDGVTVAQEVYSPDKWTDLGAQLVREASDKANTEAGDATTTAIVLAHSMCKEGMAAVSKRANVYQLSKGMKKAVDVCVKKLADIAVMIESEEDYRKVATISTQDEDLGKIISKTFMEAGKNGSIDIERSDEPGIKAEKTEGMSFDKGWDASFAFSCYVNDPKGKRCIQEDIPVLVVDKRIENETQLIPIMEFLADTRPVQDLEKDRAGWPLGIRKLLVVCDDFSGSALGLLVANNKFNPQVGGRAYHLIFTKAPSYGLHKIEIMKDICAVTGATFISEEHGGIRVEYATPFHLGRAKKIIIEDKRTIIVAPDAIQNKKSVSDRLELLQAQLADMPQDHIDRRELETRLATLTDGISVLKVGAESENERHELKRRVEDGIRAVRAAREEGVSPGCGVGLLRCVEDVEKLLPTAETPDERKGMEIVRKALHSVTLRLLEVAYVERFDLSPLKRTFMSKEKQRKSLVEAMKEQFPKNIGYDFEHDDLGDMFEKGITDAKKAVRVALQAASSCAATFLRLEAAVSEIPDEQVAFDYIRDKLMHR